MNTPTPNNPATPRWRVMTYNILDGGLGRLDPIYETLLYLDADIIGLCEADDPKGVRYLAEKIGMDHILAESPNSRHHVALLSKHPIQQAINLMPPGSTLGHAAIEVMIDLPLPENAGHQSVRVILTHLPPGVTEKDEKLRQSTMQSILSSITPDDRPTILMGDLNALAPYHPTDLSAMPPHRRARFEDQGGVQHHTVIESLCEQGWVDAYHALHQNDQLQHTFSTGFPAARVDYLFLDQQLSEQLESADIETGGFAPYCSDHYPVWADLTPTRLSS